MNGGVDETMRSVGWLTFVVSDDLELHDASSNVVINIDMQKRRGLTRAPIEELYPYRRLYTESQVLILTFVFPFRARVWW